MKLVSVYDRVDAPAILYLLLIERSTEDDASVNISHRALPSPAEHMAFYMRRPYTHWDLIMIDEQCAGYVSSTPRNEIGIVLFAIYRGKGLGTQALRMFMEAHQPLPAVPSERGGDWLANINPKNQRSMHVFRKLGFELLQMTFVRKSDPPGTRNMFAGSEQGSKMEEVGL